MPASRKQLSVMAWIEDPYGNLLLVKQDRGRKAWSFPGGKVGPRESLLDALRREVKEELNLTVDAAMLIDLFDRPQKGCVTHLFRVILKSRPRQTVRVRRGEIGRFAFRRRPPSGSTASLRYFWGRAQRTFEPLAVFAGR